MILIDINNPKENCNLACEFCYSWELQGQLTLDDIKKILKKNPFHNIIELGGGEPLFHKEIDKIVAHITLEAQKNVHISTNATHIPQLLCELPKEAREKTTIQVSLHASYAKLFGEITSNESLFDRVIENIPVFKKHFKTAINTVVYSKNFSDVPNIVDLVHKYDLAHRINLAMPIGAGKNVLLLNSAQISDLTSYLMAQKSSGKKIESPLLRINNCPVLAQAYGIPKTGACPLESNSKLYFNPKSNCGCEFLPEK